MHDMSSDRKRMEKPIVSIFCSAIRSRIWEQCLHSLLSTSVEFEVIFGGPCTFEETNPFIEKYPFFKYIKTENIKPAQVYETCRRKCLGEVISWIADDVEFSEDCYGKAYRYWKALGNEKVALSIQTIEDGYKYNMNDHSFVGFDRSTPLMAPVVLMNRKVMDEVGGFDNRFVAGQYENDAIMQLYEIGGSVLIFKDVECYIDHEKKHKGEHNFRAGFTKDRQVLESIWGKRGELLHTGKSLKHEPYMDKDILVKSQSNNNPSIWA